jgi:hypothetical protein
MTVWMRAHSSLAWLMGAGVVLAVSCGGGDDTPPPVSAVGSGGTHPHGGSSGAAGGAGEGGRAASSGGSSGSGAGEAPRAGSGNEQPAAGSGGFPESGDIGANAGAGNAGGAPGPGDDMGRLYVGPGGFASARGTRDEPFGTLAQALDVAKSGNTIVFLDGNYPVAALDEALVVPDGVDIIAENPRFVTLLGDGGPLLAPAGSTHLEGLRFNGFATVLDVAKSGAVTVASSSFSSCPDDGTYAVEAAGSATVELSAPDGFDWGDCAAFAHVRGAATFGIDGGIVHFTATADIALFSATDTATLEVNNLDATDGNCPALRLDQHSTAHVVQTTLSTLGGTDISLEGSASLELTNSELSLALAAAPGNCIDANGTGDGSISIVNSLIHICETAVAGVAPATFTLKSSELYGATVAGIDFASGTNSTITISDSAIHDVGMRAVRLGDGGSDSFAVTVRRTSVSNVDVGFELDGSTSSSWDFGTLTDAGGNTFAATMTSLKVLSGAGSFVTAIGNTWTPDAQGADGSGLYTVDGAGAVLEVTSGTGQNYDADAGATLRLAENP